MNSYPDCNVVEEFRVYIVHEFMLDGAGLQPRNTAHAAGGLEVAGSTLARAIIDSTRHRGVVQQLPLPDTVLGVDCQ